MQDLVERIRKLSPEHRAVVIAQNPLSFAQERLWFLTRLEPKSGLYSGSYGWRIHGAIEVRALRRALDELVRRHEVLRTSFPEIDGVPIQLVEPPRPANFRAVDLSGLAEGRREEEARRLCLAERRRGFDVTRSSLFSILLVRLAAETHLLLFTTHHLVTDWWSSSILNHELALLYAAELAGQRSPLAELPIQYSDFARWQRGWLDAARLERELDYWRRALRGAPIALALPLDYPRPPAQRFRGERAIRMLGTELTARLGELTRELRVTRFMALTASFAALLARYSGQDDLLIGAPIASRSAKATEQLIGLFLNTLVIRVKLPARATFRELLSGVATATLEALDHRELPFEKLVESLAPTRDLSRNPLFQVLLVAQNARTEDLALAGVEVTPFEVPRETSMVDLCLSADDAGAELRLMLEYNSDLFRRSTAERMLDHLERIMRAAIEDPDVRWAALPPARPGEYPRSAVGRREPSILERWRTLVAASPDAIAVACGRDQLTRAALEAASNRLAGALRREGIGRGDRVGISLPHSIELAVALLGVLKSGAAYVPIDPGHPAERRRAIIEDARLTKLIEHLGGAIAGESESQGSPQAPADPDPRDLAYLVYTSGSTGAPKGVAVEHGALAAVLGFFARELGVTGEDVLLAATTISFDIAALELLLPVITGARLELSTARGAADPVELREHLARTGTTIFQATPSLWRALLEHDQPPLPQLTALCGGEALSRELADRLLARGLSLWNVYGPSEATIWCTRARITADGASIAIGAELDGDRVYLLDANLEPVPPGVLGELYVAGIGLARGYWLRPELTAAAFIPDPFAPEPGARMYRTGDLGRSREDGTFEFAGRRDTQVKIRGHRIELGEIEAALASAANVAEAVVTARPGSDGELSLIAYYTARARPPPNGRELRAELATRLPAAAIPARFVALDRLPLNAAGKIDRRALPDPPHERALETSFAAPATATETALAAIWCELLGIPIAGATDDFFELGGHSLLAVRLMSRLPALGASLPLRVLFEQPTIRGLAARVDEARGEPQAMALPRVPDSDLLPLSPAERGLWFLSRLQPENAAYNTAHATRISAVLDTGALERSLAAVLDRHETLRSSFVEQGGRPFRRISAGQPFQLTELDLSRDKTAAREVVEREARRPFDLGAAPLFRAQLIRLARDEHLLLIVVHHIVCDGLSLDLLLKEVAAAYRNDGVLALPPTARHRDYLAWESARLEGEAARRSLSYWRDHLRDAAVLNLPLDHPRPALPKHAGGAVELVAGEPTIARLAELGRRTGATLFMVLLAAFAALLRRFTRQDDICIGTPVSGRHHPAADSMIGFFANAIVVRLDLSGDPPFVELLRRVKKTVLDALEHELPFEILVEELAPDRDLSRNPFFDAIFVFQEQASPPLRLAGADTEPFAIGLEVTKFDLALAFQASGTGVIKFDLELFERSSIGAIARALINLLDEVSRDPSRRLSEVALATADERDLLLAAWNASHLPRRDDRALHELFEAHARRSPGSIAIYDHDEQVTYGELDRRANQIANHLRARGLRAEGTAGVLLDRTPDLIAVLLGILKAGGAYVPLGFDVPRDRIAHQLRIARTTLVISAARWVASLPEDGPERVLLDRDAAAIAAEPDAHPELAVAPRSLAYVIFTSGTTGAPKGVAIEHACAVAFVRWAESEHDRAELAGVVAGTSIAFDLSVFEIFAPLSTGGAIVLAENGIRLPTGAARRAMRTLNTVPSTADVLLATEADLSPARTINLAGEPLSTALVDRLYRASFARVRDLYGPTECTTYSTATARQSGHSPTIGRAIAGSVVYVLDEDGEPAPPGFAGEIHIGGLGVARGYSGRPDLTAERFVPNPFARSPGERMYRTGDLGRYRPNGELELLGRRDRQVKIRGFRIELGEIEEVLRAHPAVRAAAVIVRSSGKEPQLAAYVVLAPGASGAAKLPADLRSHLAARLPGYMIPQAIVALEELPLTSNGKLDQRSLPDPDDAIAEDAKDAPLTHVQAVLLELVREVLERDCTLGAGFFEAGGSSLLAVQLLSRLRSVFGVKLDLRAIFELPTLGALAARIEAEARSGGALDDPPIERGKEAQGPLSFAQQRLWLLQLLQPASGALNLHGAIRIRGALDVAALRRAIDRLLERHPALRTRYSVSSHGPVQEILPFEPIAMPMIDLSLLAGSLRDRTALDIAAVLGDTPFDLSSGPLLRAGLLRLEDRHHVLVLAYHHLAADGWSSRIMMSELWQAYKEAPMPPPAAVRYVDFARWERERIDSEGARRRIEEWTRRWANAPATIALPLDRPRTAAVNDEGSRVDFELDAATVAAAARLARAEGATQFIVWLAALEAFLAAMLGEEQIVIGVPFANRSRPEVQRTVGLFVNPMPLSIDFGGDPTFRECVARAREEVIASSRFEDLPFERLVAALQQERRPGVHPLFQVWFVFDDEERAGAGELEAVFVERASVRHDLKLGLALRSGALIGAFEYRTALFGRRTIADLTRRFTRFVERALGDPRIRLGELAASALPSLVRPKKAALDLCSWAAENAEEVRRRLRSEGAILLRGFGRLDVERFETFAKIVCGELVEYENASTPRTNVFGRVYSSTEYPASHAIPLHNELSYSSSWPAKIAFLCVRPAEEGGRTPLADSRELYRLIDPEIRERFVRRGLMYVRNMGGPFDLPWERVFGSSNRARVEELCRMRGIEHEWLSGGRLRTRQRRPAVIVHPESGEPVWFNQAHLFHPSALAPEVRTALQASLAPEEMPRTCLYADGSELEEEALAEIRRCFERATQLFTWTAGDVLLADNMLVAHGREPFRGTRSVLVAMGGEISG